MFLWHRNAEGAPGSGWEPGSCCCLLLPLLNIHDKQGGVAKRYCDDLYLSRHATSISFVYDAL
jgi:hypothetical protein